MALLACTGTACSARLPGCVCAFLWVHSCACFVGVCAPVVLTPPATLAPCTVLLTVALPSTFLGILAAPSYSHRDIRLLRWCCRRLLEPGLPPDMQSLSQLSCKLSTHSIVPVNSALQQGNNATLSLERSRYNCQPLLQSSRNCHLSCKAPGSCHLLSNQLSTCSRSSGYPTA